MKTIQWYPGHMAKAVRMMEENITLCDAVVFVLDARCPAASYNARLSALAGSKPVLFLLNKADLADPNATDALLAQIRRSGRQAIRISCTAASSLRILREAMEQLVREKAERLREKGSKKPLRFLIAGIPNTGKSTLINLLAGAKKAVTGDKAGVTRAKQWVKCGGFELMDTPGTMPPCCDDQILARRLAYVGCINDEILETDEIALALLGELSKLRPSALSERYGIEEELTPAEMLDRVCKTRGFILRGGEFDYERGERAVIDDLRKGKLGRITFDSAADLAAAGLARPEE